MVAPMKWAALARNGILAGSWCLFFGGFPYINYYPDYWPAMAIYAWIVGVAGIVLFWPVERLGRALVIVQNYWINGLFIIAVGIYPCLEIPSLIGGIMLIAAGVLSLLAGINGEVGLSLEELEKLEKPRA